MADLTSKAADFRQRATIQQYTVDQSQDTGEVYFDDNSWTTEGETWVDAQQLSGRDYVIAQQSGYVASHMVRLRYRPGIKERTTRFIVNGVKLYVIHPNNVGNRNARLEVLCRSVEAQV